MTRRVEEINVKIVYTRFRTRVTRDDPALSVSPPSSARWPGGYVQALPFFSLNFFLVRPSRNSILQQQPFSNHDQSQPVAPRSYDPVREATPGERTRGRNRDGGSCTVQPDWRTFDPDSLHAGCTTRPAGCLIEIEGEHPFARTSCSRSGFWCRARKRAEIHVIFSANDAHEIRSMLEPSLKPASAWRLMRTRRRRYIFAPLWIGA